MLLLPARPDLSFVIKELARGNSRPTISSVQNLKRCLKYIQGTKNHVFEVGRVSETKGQEESKITIWADSNWAAPRSTSGWIISWNDCILQTASKTQPSPALSSAEAEIVAGCEAAKEGRFAANLLGEIEDKKIELELRCDASAAVAFARDLG